MYVVFSCYCSCFFPLKFFYSRCLLNFEENNSNTYTVSCLFYKKWEKTEQFKRSIWAGRIIAIILIFLIHYSLRLHNIPARKFKQISRKVYNWKIQKQNWNRVSVYVLFLLELRGFSLIFEFDILYFVLKFNKIITSSKACGYGLLGGHL